MKVCINGQDHMTKMAAMAIYVYIVKPSKIFFRTRRPMILKLGMKQQRMELYKVCVNHDPGMIGPILRPGQQRLPMHLNWEN